MKAMEEKIHLHNWVYFFQEEKICLERLKYKFGRVYSLEESLSGALVSLSISHQLLSGWGKKKNSALGLEREREKKRWIHCFK